MEIRSFREKIRWYGPCEEVMFPALRILKREGFLKTSLHIDRYTLQELIDSLDGRELSVLLEAHDWAVSRGILPLFPHFEGLTFRGKTLRDTVLSDWTLAGRLEFDGCTLKYCELSFGRVDYLLASESHFVDSRIFCQNTNHSPTFLCCTFERNVGIFVHPSQTIDFRGCSGRVEIFDWGKVTHPSVTWRTDEGDFRFP